MPNPQNRRPGKIPADVFKKAVKQFEIEKVELEKNNKLALEYRKSPAELEEERGVITFHIIWNNYEPTQSRTKLRWLFELQRIYGIQLPKMPKEYLSRIIFDRNHRSLVVHKKDKGVIGGICYRTFEEQGFVEIVFCAITADEQVKGYGSHMMNHLKDYMVECGVYHLLTYADEFAIGYFKKQDFITNLALSPERYKGFIKDYQGATLMGCQLHPKIVYIKCKELFSDMRHLYTCILHEKHPNVGRKFEGIEHLFERNEGGPLAVSEVPGLKSISDFAKHEAEEDDPMEDLDGTLRTVLNKLRADKSAWPFLKPVNKDDVPEYHVFIPFPVDLGTISARLKEGYYIHERMFIADLKRMFANCYKFNAPDSLYYFHGYKLNESFNKLVRTYFPHTKLHAKLPEVRPSYVPTKR